MRNNEGRRGENPPDENKQAALAFGVTYWPSRQAMYWWRDFQSVDLREDFERMAETGFTTIRIFLLWEDFQPRPNRVVPAMIDKLITVLETADRYGIRVVITPFCGFACGLIWLPPWMVTTRLSQSQYRVFCCGKARDLKPRNLFDDPEVIQAQAFYLRELGNALKDHPAIRAWDLGYQVTKWARTKNREQLDIWIRVLAETLKEIDETVPLTIGIGEEDLTKYHRLLSEVMLNLVDYISLTIFPLTSAVPHARKDPHYACFFINITNWLTDKKKTIVGAFGLPVIVNRTDRETLERRFGEKAPEFLTEEEARDFLHIFLTELSLNGISEALFWCYSDFEGTLMCWPPFDTSPQESFFGLWTARGEEKETLAVVIGTLGVGVKKHPRCDTLWIDIDRSEYWTNPSFHFERLYKRYKESR